MPGSCWFFSGRPDLELHAVISRAGEQVLELELGLIPGELARQFVGRLLDHLGLEHQLTHRWEEE
jgi:3-polyprenyl-4-hydroxybenzoate decarboxylase